MHRLDAVHHLLEQDVAVVGEDGAAGVVHLEGLRRGLTDLDGPVRIGDSSLLQGNSVSQMNLNKVFLERSRSNILMPSVNSNPHVWQMCDFFVEEYLK